MYIFYLGRWERPQRKIEEIKPNGSKFCKTKIKFLIIYELLHIIPPKTQNIPILKNIFVYKLFLFCTKTIWHTNQNLSVICLEIVTKTTT